MTFGREGINGIFLRGDVKSRGDQFDDKFLRNETMVVKSDYSKVKLIEATFFVKKNFKLKFRISVSFI